jgi:hypothetical protein
MHDAGPGRDFLSASGEDAVATRTITLDDNEFIEVTAALELMLDHCDVVDGHASAFSAHRQRCEAILRKLRTARS